MLWPFEVGVTSKSTCSVKLRGLHISAAVKTLRTWKLPLIGARFGRVIPRSIQLLGDCVLPAKNFRDRIKRDKGVASQIFGISQIRSILRRSPQQATRSSPSISLDVRLESRSEADVRTIGRGACPPPPNHRTKTGSRRSPCSVARLYYARPARRIQRRSWKKIIKTI
mgnify:CR=1 FL=1